MGLLGSMRRISLSVSLLVLLLHALVLASVFSGAVQAEHTSTALELSDEGEAQVEDSADSSTVEPLPDKVLVPTTSWQVVEDDMAIPRGLHVRMNLETGVKEAKLLDPTEATQSQGIGGAGDGSDDSRTIDVQVPRDLRQGIVNTKRMAFTPEQLEERMNAEVEVIDSNDGQRAIAYEDTSTADPESKETPEEIARRFAAARQKVRHLRPSADVEVMQALVAILKNASALESQQLAALRELEYLVHQIDNARDLDSIGGMEPVVSALGDTSEDLRSLAALTLGSAMQGNPAVQDTVLQYNVLPKLLAILRQGSGQPAGLRRRTMFALSALVRSHTQAQEELWLQDGLRVLTDLCQQSLPGHVPALCVKAVTLIYDFVVEEAPGQMAEQRRKLLPELARLGWCEVVTGLLSSRDGDVLEKSVAAMQALVPACGNAWSLNALAAQQLDTLDHHWQRESGSSDDDQDQYFATMRSMVANLQTQLTACVQHSNCSVAEPAQQPGRAHTEL